MSHFPREENDFAVLGDEACQKIVYFQRKESSSGEILFLLDSILKADEMIIADRLHLKVSQT